jgi:hypothetical protein
MKLVENGLPGQIDKRSTIRPLGAQKPSTTLKTANSKQYISQNLNFRNRSSANLTLTNSNPFAQKPNDETFSISAIERIASQRTVKSKNHNQNWTRPFCSAFLQGIFLRFFKIGNCGRGNNCNFLHFGQPGCTISACANPNCRDIHIKKEDAIAYCYLFPSGRCKTPNCSFHHIDFEPDAPLCLPFLSNGFCRLGRKCPAVHLFTCPEVYQGQQCPRGADCRLPHIYKRSNNSSKELIVDGGNVEVAEVVVHSQTLDKNADFIGFE